MYQNEQLGEPGTKGYKRGHRQYMKEYWQKRPRKYIIASTKSRAKKAGIPFNIEAIDIQIPETCPVLNVPLGPVHNEKDKEHSPSIDRINPKLGYIKGNIRIISWKANKYKSDMTFDIIERLYKYVSETR